VNYCEDHLQNDLDYVGQGVKLYFISNAYACVFA